jgi:hypothetical protein
MVSLSTCSGFLLFTDWIRYCINKIASVKRSGHGKACTACVKAKQRCGGGEKWMEWIEQAEVETSAGPMVMKVLGELVKVLHLMHYDLHDIKVAIKDHWGGEKDDELVL